MGRGAQRFAFACASTSQGPSRSSSEHSPPPGTLLRALLTSATASTGGSALSCARGRIRSYTRWDRSRLRSRAGCPFRLRPPTCSRYAEARCPLPSSRTPPLWAGLSSRRGLRPLCLLPYPQYLIPRTFYATIGARLSGGSRVPSAVYLPYLPPAFSPSALLSLSPSWLSLLPVPAVACLFRALSSPAVCPALPCLLPAGAPRLRPPVRRPQRRRSRPKRL